MPLFGRKRDDFPPAVSQATSQDDFLERFIREAGFKVAHVPGAKEELLKNFNDGIARIFLRMCFERLTPQQHEGLNRLVVGGASNAERVRYMQQYIPNLSHLLQQAWAELYYEYIPRK